MLKKLRKILIRMRMVEKKTSKIQFYEILTKMKEKKIKQLNKLN